MDIKSNIEFFWKSFLSRPASSIPKGAQWAISFLDLEAKILPSINEAYKYEPIPWTIDELSVKSVINEELHGAKGCMFAQAISLPGESHQTNTAGNIQSNALIRARVGGGRNEFGLLKITFLETNVSFVDSFLRGWALATANFGMIARKDGDPLNYRTSLICNKFGIGVDGPFITQQILFEGVCCTSVSNEEYNYTPIAGQPILREAEFVFNSYSIDTTQIPSTVSSNPYPTTSNQNATNNNQAFVGGGGSVQASIPTAP
jgi:hypothetical protein